jgi:uncharacterized protein YndB with AHSA1/START domain
MRITFVGAAQVGALGNICIVPCLGARLRPTPELEKAMGQIEVRAEAQTSAGPARVFALLKDGSTWTEWSMFSSYALERPGPIDPLGVGSVRVFATRISKTREEVVEIVPDQRLSYTLLSGLPFVGYRADVELEPRAGGGTLIRWSSRFRVKRFGTGWFWSWIMKRSLRTVAGQLADGAANPMIAPSSGLDPRTSETG